jgi:hypothetical protein
MELHLNRRQPRFFDLQVQDSLRTRAIISKKRQYHDIASTRVSGKNIPRFKAADL